MLLPALSSARESAKTTSCVNNASSLAKYTRMYADDNNDWAPHANCSPASGSGLAGTYAASENGGAWFVQMAPYAGWEVAAKNEVTEVRENSPLECPSRTSDISNKTGGTKIDFAPVMAYFNYASSYKIGNFTCKRQNYSKMVDPSGQLFLMDAASKNNPYALNQTLYDTANFASPCHQGEKAWTASFFDGHAESVLKDPTIKQSVKKWSLPLFNNAP